MKKMREIVIPISKIVGGGICVSASDGQKVYNEVRSVVISDNKVTLSFSGVSRMTTAFLNAAVGQLYGEFSAKKIKRHLGPPVDYEDWHLSRLKMVVDRAKEFFDDEKHVKSVFEHNTGHRR